MPLSSRPESIQLEDMDKNSPNGLVHPEDSLWPVPMICGDSQNGMHKRTVYEHNRVAMCSQKRALCLATVVLSILFTISLIIAYAGPQTDCPCAGERPPYMDEHGRINGSRNIIPIATNNELFPWNNLRLPHYVRPTRYHINIHPNLTTLDVKGQVTIDFQVDKDTYFLVLNSQNLTITDKMVTDRKSHRFPIARMLEYPPRQQLYLEMKDKFRKKVNYTIVMRFTTRLSREMEGFYISSYTNKDGEKRYLATTHFEPTYARSAFPCFDEPQFKAKFKMSIFRDRFHISLFNMPIINTEDAGFYMGTGLLRDDFQESVEMSTYLVAFVVCDYQHIRKETERGVSVAVYAPPDLLPQAQFALDTATAMMDYYEGYFNISYPLPKQDLIAIPDFGVGAMENWGLITYKETSILYEPDQTSAAAHQWVAVVVAHELAHQFGNLVTMRWWSDLWLNEGLASFLEYQTVDEIMPGWNMMEQFVLDKTQAGLNLDALSNSHPISVAVQDPTEIEAIFDTISYSKGAALLYMMETFLGEDTLKAGLTDYLDTHKYSNADTKDLWAIMSKHANHSIRVKNIMDTWTRQMGFPLIELTRENEQISASQTRFLLTPEPRNENSTAHMEPKAPYGYKWYVPLSYYTDVSKEETIWMNMTDVKFEINSSATWLKANINQSGFYRVNYDSKMWEVLVATLKKNHSTFSPTDRASLLDDAFTLCRAGLLNISTVLDMSLYLREERDYVPWATALIHLQSWARFLSESAPYRRFLNYTSQLISPVAQSLGWADEGTHLEKLMRSDILVSAVLSGVKETVKEARQKFHDWKANKITIPPNLREAVYTAGIKYGGVEEWNHCWEKYNTTRIPSEKKLLLRVLGVASDPWILQRYLLSTLDRDKIRPQDIKVVVSAVSSNPEGGLLAWRHLKAHWRDLQTLFGNGTFTMGSLISAVTPHFSTEYDYKEVDMFFRHIDVGSGSRALDQCLETIKLNIHWVRRNEQILDDWLIKYLNS
ncbi:endoplasmic reticulum aminopeptidase 1-like isoform X2 [Cimex lectularius]|uniref:Aminopeptidase n=1 Tax=Cimex lectularius TaxID=79782 RepID=A0A8I6SN99_CIMLE|nr:endoplasmic reticulum aminopeptidase 1-like isoform X2 [Cimex lectularius]